MLAFPHLRVPRILNLMTLCAGAACVWALALAPSLYAQEALPPDPVASQRPGTPPSAAVQPVSDLNGLGLNLYSLNFEGHDVQSLEKKLKINFPDDNVVIARSAKSVRLDAFEVRNVRLQEPRSRKSSRTCKGCGRSHTTG
jgi:hypothetical protein